MTIQSSELVEGLTKRLALEHLIGREPSTLDRVRSVLAEELGHRTVGLKLVDKIIQGVAPAEVAEPAEPEIVVQGEPLQRPPERPHSHEAFVEQTANEYAKHQVGKGRAPIPVEHIANVEVEDGENTSVFKLGDEVTYDDEVVSVQGRITSFEKGPDGGMFAHLDFDPTGVPAHALKHPQPEVASDPTASSESGASPTGSSTDGQESGDNNPDPSQSAASDSISEDPARSSSASQPTTQQDAGAEPDQLPDASAPATILDDQSSAGSSPSSTTERSLSPDMLFLTHVPEATDAA